MRRLAVLLVAAVSVVIAPTVAGADAGAGSLQITQDESTVSTSIGQRFSFASTLRNTSTQPTGPLVAHLNIVSLQSDVYVDPEDWSPRRTQFVESVPPGGSTTLSWTVQAVNHGRFIVYVVVAPEPEGSVLAVGPALRVGIASQRTLNAGGILPIALAVPGVVLVSLLAARFRRRRLTR